ncbi:MAG: hypothetical protein JRD89_02900 [Deltaproteobacteria bacterium]|nr:hypothetical protein [Deltaproteobacteria bacterium]
MIEACTYSSELVKLRSENARNARLIEVLKAERDRHKAALEKIARARRGHPDPAGNLEHMIVTYVCRLDSMIEIARKAL